jgi:ABC-type sugar transport system ATPase subunit
MMSAVKAVERGVRIRLLGCAKRFRHRRVLETTDPDIEAGETRVLLGPSGRGKTTSSRTMR